MVWVLEIGVFAEAAIFYVWLERKSEFIDGGRDCVLSYIFVVYVKIFVVDCVGYFST